MNIKRHDVHFLKAKKTKTNSKLFLSSRSKEFSHVSCVFFNDANVTKAIVFCKEGLKPNQFVRKVRNETNLGENVWNRSSLLTRS